MKNLFLLLFTAILLISCEDLETNDPAMQGTIDHAFFKALNTRATIEANGDYLIEGINQDEILSVRITGPEEGDYFLGGEFGNEGSFIDVNGNIYTTKPNGGGKVIVTNWDTSGKTISGTFKFTGILEGLDTLRVHNGVFFEVPYFTGEEDPNPNAGTISAEISGEPWEAFTVTALDNGESIIAKGATVSIIIRLKVPSGIEPGVYSMNSSTFNATYQDDDTSQESATSGSIEIIEHNVGNKTISGIFFFGTDSENITSGQFNVTYQ